MDQPDRYNSHLDPYHTPISLLPKFSINLDESFPTLEAAPSIEAVIHWQANASKTLEPETVKAELVKRFPSYESYQSQQDIEIGATGSHDGISEVFHRSQWHGFRLENEQNHYVAQFTRAGVVFSRLSPYEGWISFQAEAFRFWDIFLELAAPTTIERLGVRYINRIPLETGESPSTYLITVPCPPPDLALAPDSFFHQDTYPVPGYPYTINWVRTIQAGDEPNDGQALIVDIDVFTHGLLQLDHDTLAKQLQEMRWLKNKTFFSSITPHALERFGVVQ